MKKYGLFWIMIMVLKIFYNIFFISSFRDFEKPLWTKTFQKKIIKPILKVSKSQFVFVEVPLGVYEIIDIKITWSDLVKVNIGTGDITMKKRLKAKNSLRLYETSFFNLLLSLSPKWDYRFNQNYFIEKIIKINPTDKIRLQCKCITGSKLGGVREPILCSFILSKPPGEKVQLEPEAVHFNKTNSFVSLNITFYLEVDFSGETLIFTVLLIKIYECLLIFYFLKNRIL